MGETGPPLEPNSTCATVYAIPGLEFDSCCLHAGTEHPLTSSRDAALVCEYISLCDRRHKSTLTDLAMYLSKIRPTLGIRREKVCVVCS